ncbi:hypothetical protein AB835_04660 [Candidatus Endobugula sertula]|uniref:Uncharacterized protein n=1 Tax=Candidatus Endobugula sertula TaxID=62101 RepID=A0A1D2QRK4_9GAMM|nr:hypothetical protein AB835_04660 [Candidatus Endobugula sertula]
MQKTYILELCEVNPSENGKTKISPIGKVTGRDGRVFEIDGQRLLNRLKEDGLKIPLTIGHEYEGKAGGWFYDFEIEDAFILAQLDLNKLGAELIENDEYKYLSPEYYVDYDTNQVELMSAVSLVNKPNLLKEALNHTEPENMPAPTDNNDVQKQLQELKDQNAKLTEQNKALLEQTSMNKVDNAIANKKLAPAKRDYALKLEANALDDFLKLEAQTFNPTENNSLNPESDDSDNENNEVFDQLGL